MVRGLSDKIERYLSGDFDYEGGSLIFSCSKIEITTLPMKDYEGEFFIEEQSGKEFSGKIYSSHLTVECINPEFSGTGVTIAYKTNIQGSVPGDVLTGELYIVSDMGEYVIPYVINVSYENIESSLGPIKNMFHFTNLAKSNWNEAVSVFYNSEFVNILVGNDKKYSSLYRGLIATGNPNRNLEEFLVGINKKQPIEYTVDKDAIKLVNPENIEAQMIRLNRSGWGYVKLKVKSQGDFIVLERNLLKEEDFQGNTCEYLFYIDENGLHDGNNYGKITFTHPYGSFDVLVNVVCVLGENDMHTKRQEKKTLYRITRTYLDFRVKRLTGQKCVAQTKELLSYIKNISDNYVSSSLAEAHLMIVQEKYNEAKWLLDYEVGDPEDLEDDKYCYYLYLTVLYSADDFYALEVAERIKSIYQKNMNNWRIAWVYMQLAPEFNRSAISKWNFAMELLHRGCTSPIIYIEMLTLLNSNPALVGHLEQEHLRVFLFGAKNQYLSDELCSQIVSAAVRVKQYNKQLLRILEAIYEKKPDKYTLQAICILLMKGEREDVSVHHWYALGVENSLPITRLYEYYMMSLNTNENVEISKGVLMYFSYECNLPVKYAAYIYKYMHVHRSKYPELYELYRPQIARFIVKQLYAEKVTADLAYLYQEILMKEMLTPDNASQFATLMFVNCIRIERKDIVSVVIMDERLTKEYSYPVNSGMAYVSIFGSDYTILLEDEKGNRYFGTDDYQIECFFLPRKFIPYVNSHAKDSIPYNLYVCGGYQDLYVVTKDNCKRYCYLEQSEIVEKNYRSSIRMSLLNYYFEQDDVDALNELLERMNAEDVPIKSRADFVRMLSIHGCVDKAYELIVRYGVENIDPKTIVRVCTSIVEQKSDMYDYDLVRIIYSAFERGKYNDTVLMYLVKYYAGSAKILRNIWKAAVNFEIGTYEICERILMQVMETGVFIGEEEQVYKQYVQGGAKSDIDLAYISYVCFEYMMFDRVLKSYVFENIERIYADEKCLPDVCMMAYLQYHSNEVESLTYEQKKLCRELIRTLYHVKRIVMPYFANYKSISLDAESISYSTLITYKGNPKSRVVLHYMISRESSEENGYVKETMEKVFGGIYVKEFVLFFGESLQYYITEEYGNKEQLTESGTIQKNDAMEESTVSRFSMVNDIAVATTLKDYSTAKELLKEYAEREYIAKELFSLQ